MNGMFDVEGGILKHVIKVVGCYASQDHAAWLELEGHLGPLKNSGLVTIWCEQQLEAGSLIEQERETHWKNADLILPLVSHHFFNASNGLDLRMQSTLQRYERAEIHIAPVLFSPCDYHRTSISELAILPVGGRAITQWTNRQNAYANVAKELRKVVFRQLAQKWKVTGNLYQQEKRYGLALQAYNEAHALNQDDSLLYTLRGEVLINLQHFEEAVSAYESALQFDPLNPDLYKNKALALFNLNRFEEAVAVYDRAIELKNDFGLAYFERGKALEALAQQSFEKFTQLAQQSFKQAKNIMRGKKKKGKHLWKEGLE